MSRCKKHGEQPLGTVDKCLECDAQFGDDGDKKFPVYTKKQFVLMNTSIRKFHRKFYGPAIDKLAYHYPHVILLGTQHCSKTRREAFHRRKAFKDAKAQHDYAERLIGAFFNQIHSEYYGHKRSVSMEGIALETFKKEQKRTD